MSLLGKRRVEAQLAFVFLTRLPVGRLPDDYPSMAQAAWAFPIVGLVVGGLSGLVYVLAAMFWTPPIAAVLAIAAGLVLTGALHEDGLADVADGFGGGATRENKLEIMRDSRIGSYGVVALIVTFGLLFTAISQVPPHPAMIFVFAAVGAISRAAMLALMVRLPPARPEGLGHGAVLTAGPAFWSGLGIATVLAVLTWPPFILAAILGAGFVALVAKRQIGGQTGDVLGTCQKVSECLLWLSFVL